MKKFAIAAKALAPFAMAAAAFASPASATRIDVSLVTTFDGRPYATFLSGNVLNWSFWYDSDELAASSSASPATVHGLLVTYGDYFEFDYRKDGYMFNYERDATLSSTISLDGNSVKFNVNSHERNADQIADLALEFEPGSVVDGRLPGLDEMTSSDFSLYYHWMTPFPVTITGGTVTGLEATAVPEPATWAMMIAGFGLVGAAMRRRNAVTPALA